MAKNTGKTRVTKRTVIEETGGDTGESGGAELDLNGGQQGEAMPDAEEMGAIEKLHELAGGDLAAMYEVRRLLPSTEAGYCGTLAHEEMSMERIAEEWGAGSYNVRVRLTGGKFAGSSRVQIAPIPKHRQPPPHQVASQQQPASDATAQMIQAMQRGTDAQISMLSSLVKSLIERPLPTPPTPPPPPDTLAILATAKQLFSKNDGGDPLAMFMKGLEFGKDLGGDNDPGLGDVFMKGIDGLKELAQTPQPAPVRRLPRPGTVPATEPARIATPAAAAPVAQPATQGAPMNTMRLIQWLGQQVKHLLVQASRNKDTELYAEVFVDNLPEGLEDAVILAQLKSPDAIERLAKLDARVLQFRPWFEEFRGHCVEMIEAGPDDEDDDAADFDEVDTAPGDMPPEFPSEGGEGGGQ